MKSLVDDILSLEEKAERILDDARQEARKADQEADDEIARSRTETRAALGRRIEQYRGAAELKHQDAETAARATLAQELDRVKGIPDGVLAEQAAKIATRFCEL